MYIRILYLPMRGRVFAQLQRSPSRTLFAFIVAMITFEKNELKSKWNDNIRDSDFELRR